MFHFKRQDVSPQILWRFEFVKKVDSHRQNFILFDIQLFKMNFRDALQNGPVILSEAKNL